MTDTTGDVEFGRCLRHGLTVALLALLVLCGTCYGCEREDEITNREAIRVLSGEGHSVAAIRCLTMGYDCDVAHAVEGR